MSQTASTTVTGSRAPSGFGIAFFVIGALIAAVPSIIYQVYEAMPDMTMQCLLTARVEIAVGAFIAILGGAYFFSRRYLVRIAAPVLVIIAAAASLLFPTAWTGLCADAHMSCHMLTLPILIVSAVVLTILSTIAIMLAVRNKESIQ
ncbi:MAG: DUF4418 family protein [Clostridiales Family XIII bacterium]|jgi:hypothetical protein|nr:DUF4418 family protein [Clostridiales Family XIII bacterium]